MIRRTKINKSVVKQFCVLSWLTATLWGWSNYELHVNEQRLFRNNMGRWCFKWTCQKMWIFGNVSVEWKTSIAALFKRKVTQRVTKASHF